MEDEMQRLTELRDYDIDELTDEQRLKIELYGCLSGFIVFILAIIVCSLLCCCKTKHIAIENTSSEESRAVSEKSIYHNNVVSDSVFNISEYVENLLKQITQKDSTSVHDSVYVYVNADGTTTTYKEREITNIRYLRESEEKSSSLVNDSKEKISNKDTIIIEKKDTFLIVKKVKQEVPVPVERELTWWEKTCVTWFKWSLIINVAVIVIVYFGLRRYKISKK